jgi:hypothetical protein
MNAVLKMKHSLVVQALQQLQLNECLGKTDASSIDLNVEGGKLVSFEKKEGQFSKSFLKDQLICIQRND